MRIHPRNNDEALFDLLSRSARRLVIACDVLEQIVAAEKAGDKAKSMLLKAAKLGTKKQ